MDVMVANVQEAWGILLSHEWAAMVGGSIAIDISYVVITLPNPQKEWAAMVGGSIEMDISYVVTTLLSPQKVRLYMG